MRPQMKTTTFNISELNKVGLFRLGCLLFRGYYYLHKKDPSPIKVVADKPNGLRFLKLSADQGYEPAIQYLSLINSTQTAAASDAKQQASAASLLSSAWTERASSMPSANLASVHESFSDGDEDENADLYDSSFK
jgi:hypothetical protein